MKRVVIAVFDSAVQTYGQPVFVAGRGAGLRSFLDEVNRVDPSNTLNLHPEDFELRLLGYFDDERGTFEVPEEGIGTVIARAKDLVKENGQ